ncbi:MAG: NfeD family protein [Pyrinomonadaceae bacterium]
MPVAFNALLPCIALIVVIILFAVTVAVFASRHKKAATGEIELMGTIALVEEALSPEGAVLARGELWRARLSHHSISQGLIAERGKRVRIVGTSGHLLEVEWVD